MSTLKGAAPKGQVGMVVRIKAYIPTHYGHQATIAALERPLRDKDAQHWSDTRARYETVTVRRPYIVYVVRCECGKTLRLGPSHFEGS